LSLAAPVVASVGRGLGRQVRQRIRPAFQRFAHPLERGLRCLAPRHQFRQRRNGDVPPIARRARRDRFEHRLADARLHRIGSDCQGGCALGRHPEHLVRALERTEPPFDGGRYALLRHAFGLTLGDLAFQQRDRDTYLPGPIQRAIDALLRPAVLGARRRGERQRQSHCGDSDSPSHRFPRIFRPAHRA
jgi:hypothetical protein